MTEATTALTDAELESQDDHGPDREAMSVLGDALDPSALLETSLLNVDSTWPSTPTWPRRSTPRWQPTPTWPRHRRRGQRQRLSVDSEAGALADQSSLIVQDLDGAAVANAIQDAGIDQSGSGAVAG